MISHHSLLILILDGTASYKLLTLSGTIISFIGYLLLILFWRGKTNVWESLYIGPGGLGTGIVMATTFVSIAAGVDESQMAIASTGLYLSVNIGSLIGASLASTVLQTSLRKELGQKLEGFSDQENVRTHTIIIFNSGGMKSITMFNVADHKESLV